MSECNGYPADRRSRWSVEADEDDIISRLVAAHERHALDSDGEAEPTQLLKVELTEGELDALAEIVRAMTRSRKDHDNPDEISLIDKLGDAMAHTEPTQ